MVELPSQRFAHNWARNCRSSSSLDVAGMWYPPPTGPHQIPSTYTLRPIKRRPKIPKEHMFFTALVDGVKIR